MPSRILLFSLLDAQTLQTLDALLEAFKASFADLAGLLLLSLWRCCIWKALRRLLL